MKHSLVSSQPGTEDPLGIATSADIATWDSSSTAGSSSITGASSTGASSTGASSTAGSSSITGGCGAGDGIGVGAGAGGVVGVVGTCIGALLVAENDMAKAINATVIPIEKAMPNLSAAVISPVTFPR
jgi:hypothetical protein